MFTLTLIIIITISMKCWTLPMDYPLEDFDENKSTNQDAKAMIIESFEPNGPSQEYRFDEDLKISSPENRSILYEGFQSEDNEVEELLFNESFDRENAIVRILRQDVDQRRLKESTNDSYPDPENATNKNIVSSGTAPSKNKTCSQLSLFALLDQLDGEEGDESKSFGLDNRNCVEGNFNPSDRNFSMDMVYKNIFSNDAFLNSNFINGIVNKSKEQPTSRKSDDSQGLSKLIFEVHARKLNESQTNNDFEQLDKLIKDAKLSTAVLNNSTALFYNIPQYLDKMSTDLQKVFLYFRSMARSESGNQNFLTTYGKLKKSAFLIDRSYETLRQIPMKVSLLADKVRCQTSMANSLMKKYILNRLDKAFMIEKLKDILKEFISAENEIIKLLNQQAGIFYYLSTEVENIQQRFFEMEKIVTTEEELQNKFKTVARLLQDVRDVPLGSLNKTGVKEYFNKFEDAKKGNIATKGRFLGGSEANEKFSKDCNIYLFEENCDIYKYFKCLDSKEQKDSNLDLQNNSSITKYNSVKDKDKLNDNKNGMFDEYKSDFYRLMKEKGRSLEQEPFSTKAITEENVDNFDMIPYYPSEKKIFVSKEPEKWQMKDSTDPGNVIKHSDDKRNEVTPKSRMDSANKHLTDSTENFLEKYMIAVNKASDKKNKGSSTYTSVDSSNKLLTDSTDNFSENVKKESDDERNEIRPDSKIDLENIRLTDSTDSLPENVNKKSDDKRNKTKPDSRMDSANGKLTDSTDDLPKNVNKGFDDERNKIRPDSRMNETNKWLKISTDDYLKNFSKEFENKKNKTKPDSRMDSANGKLADSTDNLPENVNKRINDEINETRPDSRMDSEKNKLTDSTENLPENVNKESDDERNEIRPDSRMDSANGKLTDSTDDNLENFSKEPDDKRNKTKPESRMDSANGKLPDSSDDLPENVIKGFDDERNKIRPDSRMDEANKRLINSTDILPEKVNKEADDERNEIRPDSKMDSEKNKLTDPTESLPNSRMDSANGKLIDSTDDHLEKFSKESDDKRNKTKPESRMDSANGKLPDSSDDLPENVNKGFDDEINEIRPDSRMYDENKQFTNSIDILPEKVNKESDDEKDEIRPVSRMDFENNKLTDPTESLPKSVSRGSDDEINEIRPDSRMDSANGKLTDSTDDHLENFRKKSDDERNEIRPDSRMNNENNKLTDSTDNLPEKVNKESDERNENRPDSKMMVSENNKLIDSTESLPKTVSIKSDEEINEIRSESRIDSANGQFIDSIDDHLEIFKIESDDEINEIKPDLSTDSKDNKLTDSTDNVSDITLNADAINSNVNSTSGKPNIRYYDFGASKLKKKNGDLNFTLENANPVTNMFSTETINTTLSQIEISTNKDSAQLEEISGGFNVKSLDYNSSDNNDGETLPFTTNINYPLTQFLTTAPQTPIDIANEIEEDNFWPYDKLLKLKRKDNEENGKSSQEVTESKLNSKQRGYDLDFELADTYADLYYDNKIDPKNNHHMDTSMTDEALPMVITHPNHKDCELYKKEPNRAEIEEVRKLNISGCDNLNDSTLEQTGRNFLAPSTENEESEDDRIKKQFLNEKIKGNTTDVKNILKDFDAKFNTSQSHAKPVIYRRYSSPESECDKSEALMDNCKITVYHMKKAVASEWKLNLICGCRSPLYMGECPENLRRGIAHIINFCALMHKI